MTGKMAIIGRGDGIVAFSAGGIKPYPVTDLEQAEKTLNKLAKEYQIIFITEDLAQELNGVIKKYLTSVYPIIIPIPSGEGSSGYAMSSLKESMEKALGVDILFNEKN